MYKYLLVSTSYFPQISMMLLLLKYNRSVIIESQEYFIKHFYHNRTVIASPNGTLLLTIPIKRYNKTKTKIKDILIINSGNWQKLHYKTIHMYYKNSPFYEFYQDYFINLYSKEYKYLFDFNYICLELILKLLKINIDITNTIIYKKEYDSTFKDYRGLSSKEEYKIMPYNQVFENKTGFISNLSIIDLLFNQGNNAKDILIQSLNDFKE